MSLVCPSGSTTLKRSASTADNAVDSKRPLFFQFLPIWSELNKNDPDTTSKINSEKEDTSEVNNTAINTSPNELTEDGVDSSPATSFKLVKKPFSTNNFKVEDLIQQEFFQDNSLCFSELLNLTQFINVICCPPGTGKTTLAKLYEYYASYNKTASEPVTEWLKNYEFARDPVLGSKLEENRGK